MYFIFQNEMPVQRQLITIFLVLFTNTILMLAGYIVYRRVKAICQERHDDVIYQETFQCSVLNQDKDKVIKRSERSFLILLLLISQLYFFRTVRGLFIIFGSTTVFEVDLWDIIIPLSISLMLVGIWQSIHQSIDASFRLQSILQDMDNNYRCYSSGMDQERTTSMNRRDSDAEPSVFSEDEFNHNSLN